jgi:hypothetical protein
MHFGVCIVAWQEQRSTAREQVHYTACTEGPCREKAILCCCVNDMEDSGAAVLKGAHATFCMMSVWQIVRGFASAFVHALLTVRGLQVPFTVGGGC